MTDRQLSNPEPHPDAALLALWGDYVAIWRAKEALPVLEGHADDDQKEPLYEKIFCLENRIADVPALSVEGLTVKLRILFPSMVSVNGLDQALFCGGPEPEWRLEDENFAVRLAWSTLQDAERMIGPALSEPASGSLGALWMRDALHSLPLDVLHRMERTIGAIAAVSRARRALREVVRQTGDAGAVPIVRLLMRDNERAAPLIAALDALEVAAAAYADEG